MKTKGECMKFNTEVLTGKHTQKSMIAKVCGSSYICCQNSFIFKKSLIPVNSFEANVG